MSNPKSKDLLLLSHLTRNPDTYHSCYALAGLSSVQHYNYFTEVQGREEATPLDFAFRWASSPHIPQAKGEEQDRTFDKKDRVLPIHPIYVIPWANVEQAHDLFSQKKGF